VSRILVYLRSFGRDDIRHEVLEYLLLLAFVLLAVTALSGSAEATVKTLWTGISLALANATTASS